MINKYLFLIGIATINFTPTSYLVNEDVGSFNVCVQIFNLPNGGLDSNVTIQIILLNGTACMFANDFKNVHLKVQFIY